MQTLGVFFRVVIGMVSHVVLSTLSNLSWLIKASYTLNEGVYARGSYEGDTVSGGGRFGMARVEVVAIGGGMASYYGL